MLIKILGILDIFIAVCFWLFGIFHLVNTKFILILGFILIIKGLIFVFGLSIMSFLDIIFGVVIAISTSIAMPKIAIILIALFLLQKGIFSLL